MTLRCTRKVASDKHEDSGHWVNAQVEYCSFALQQRTEDDSWWR